MNVNFDAILIINHSLSKLLKQECITNGFLHFTDLGNSLTFDSVNPALFNSGTRRVILS